MKILPKFFSYFLILLLTIILCSCSSTNMTGDLHDSDLSDGSSSKYYGSSTEDSIDDRGAIDVSSQNQGPAPGQITAAAWSDITNYDFWLNLFESNQQNQQGLFSEYFTRLNTYSTLLNTKHMITVNIKDEIAIPLDDIYVSINNDKNFSYSTKTDIFGNAYLFLPDTLEFPYYIEYNHEVYELTEYTKDPIELQTIAPQYKEQRRCLDIMFVIDTTGSMADELEYLKSEIKDVIENINTSEELIKLSLLFYRDEGDQYITNFFDFTNNISEQIDNINKQSANGGGDFPEAVDQALNLAVTQANWSVYSTKLLIHVLDAPPHTSKNNLELFSKSVFIAAQKGIKIIPVASSGIDKWTEYLLRVEALFTGGTYTYITNHSGIGNNHIDATVGDVVIEYLNDMLVRLINEYHTGIKTEPIPYNQTQNEK